MIGLRIWGNSNFGYDYRQPLDPVKNYMLTPYGLDWLEDEKQKISLQRVLATSIILFYCIGSIVFESTIDSPLFRCMMHVVE